MADQDPIRLRLWLAGLACLAVLLALVAVLQASSAFGLAAHQTATQAAQIDTIQQAWAREGNLGLAWAVMLADLLFIGVYGLGAIVAARSILCRATGAMMLFGIMAMLGSVAFMALDYCETSLEVVQLAKGQGDQALVNIVASLMNAKLIAFAASFWGVVLAVLWRRFTPGRG